MIGGLVIALCAGLVAFVVTLAIYRNASGFGLVQPPNERSSHTRPTARGGGVGIVAGGVVAGLPLALATPWPTVPLLLLALVMAVIGILDDRFSLPALGRLVAQVVLVGLLVAVLSGDALAAALPGAGLLPAVVLLGLAALAAVVWVNFFNFMDGIDGIAGTEAIFMLLGALVLALVAGVPADAPLLLWLVGVAAATLGFLVLNWPPARIFMGDAGSTWLGFVIAAVALWTMALGWVSLVQWLLLGALFIADATLTLARRLLRGENPLRAHRLHAYQHLSRRWGAHAPVTLLYMGINVVLLLPLAIVAGLTPGIGFVALGAAYLPLVVGLVWAGAGAPEKSAA